MLTLEVPYLYIDDDGSLGRTTSEEEWKLRTALADQAARVASKASDAPASLEEAQAAAAKAAARPETTARAMRAALYAEEVPAGWSLWQEHDGAYRALTARDLKDGVSGQLVLRYDGNGGKLDASASMPAFELGFVGGVPEGTPVSIYYGYEVHSFTAKAPEAPTGRDTSAPAQPKAQYGDVKRGAAGSYALVNERHGATAKMSAKAQAAAMPHTVAGDGTGYLVHQVRYEVPEKVPHVTAFALGAAFPANYEGAQGVTAESLMAFKVDKDGKAEPNEKDGAVDTSAEARKKQSFVGVPGKGGVIVLDVTDLTDKQIASINPMKASTLKALDLTPLPYTVTTDDRIQLARTGKEGAIDAGKSRRLYVAAPYAEAALTFPKDAKESDPVRAIFDVQVGCGVGADAVVYTECLETETAFAAAAMGKEFMTDEQVAALEKEKPADDGEGAPSQVTPSGDLTNNDPLVPAAPEADKPVEPTEPVAPIEPEADDSNDPAATGDDPESTEGPAANEPAETEVPAGYREHPEMAPQVLLTA